MIRTCTADDPFIGDGPKRCGKTFDDVDHLTICPHERIPTREEKAAALEELGLHELAKSYREQNEGSKQ